MPTSTLSRSRVLAGLGGTVSDEQLEQALFASKAEASPAVDDAFELSVTPDRLDLLSEGGLALYLDGALGLRSGAVKLRRRRSSSRPVGFAVDASVGSIRPHLAGVVVQAPVGQRLDEGLLAEAIRFQELLHATVGRDRRAMSLGIYPARKLSFPVRYALEPLAEVEFVPLDGERPVRGDRFYEEHPMAQRYGALGRSGGSCLTLRDAAGAILSLPPVLNSRAHGSAAVGDRSLLLESTGTRARAVRDGLGLLLVVFAARGWSVRAVPVEGPGSARSDGETVVAGEPVVLPAPLLAQLSGVSLASAEVVERLARARLAARRVRGGWRVSVPPWRPDLLAAVDVAEDVIVVGGLRAEDGVVPASADRGRRRAETTFRRSIVELLRGLGFAEPLTTVMVSEASAARLPGTEPIRLVNPPSREFAVIRDRLLFSHLDVLAKNARHGYPQRFAEVAPVVVRAADAETGAVTRVRAGFVIAADGAGFAEAAATVDYLLRTLDVGSVREPADLPGMIPGRGARVKVAGETVAELGEIHPKLLGELGVPVPAAWAEIDLTTLGPLVGGLDRNK